MIAQHRIEQLAARQGVAADTVRNVLGAIHLLTYEQATDKVFRGQRNMGWSFETLAAIQTGILEYFTK